MKNNIVFCSLCTVNYLAQAIVLDNSLKQAGHQETHYTLIADYTRDEYTSLFSHRVPIGKNHLVFLSDLEIPNINDMVRRYNAFEFTNALKPFFMKWLLVNFPEIDLVIYLDSDIMVYQRFDAIDSFFNTNPDTSVLVTPHIYDIEAYTSQKHGPYFFERVYTEYGLYNGGFYVVKNDAYGHQFLEWHSKKLFDYGYDARSKGMFVDQKILDFAVMLFPHITIYRNKAYNLAHWNFCPGLVYKKNEIIYVGDQPLVFFHFSKYHAIPPESYVPYLLEKNDLTLFHEMIGDYISKLNKMNHSDIKNIPYGFISHTSKYKKRLIREARLGSGWFAKLLRGMILISRSPSGFFKKIQIKIMHNIPNLF